MINIAAILATVKELITGENKISVVILLFSSIICVYLYNQNTSLEEQILNAETSCNARITKVNENCQEQINKSRAIQQEQLDAFMKKSNEERDSTYKAFEKILRFSNNKIKQNINDISNLKEDEQN